MGKKLTMERYADDLKEQMMKNDLKKLKEYEMTDKEKQYNNQGIQYYLDGKIQTNNKVVPGFDKTRIGDSKLSFNNSSRL